MNQIERACFAGQHITATLDLSKRQRPEAMRIADRDQAIARQHDQRERALDPSHRREDAAGRSGLREKVEDDPTRPSRLVTVWGVGYRWELSWTT